MWSIGLWCFTSIDKINYICFLTSYRQGSYYTIRLGEHNRNVPEGTEQNIPGKQVIKHPSYNRPSAINNDIALIQLERPATLNARVGTVCCLLTTKMFQRLPTVTLQVWDKLKRWFPYERDLFHGVSWKYINGACHLLLSILMPFRFKSFTFHTWRRGVKFDVNSGLIPWKIAAQTDFVDLKARTWSNKASWDLLYLNQQNRFAPQFSGVFSRNLHQIWLPCALCFWYNSPIIYATTLCWKWR